MMITQDRWIYVVVYLCPTIARAVERHRVINNVVSAATIKTTVLLEYIIHHSCDRATKCRVALHVSRRLGSWCMQRAWNINQADPDRLSWKLRSKNAPPSAGSLNIYRVFEEKSLGRGGKSITRDKRSADPGVSNALKFLIDFLIRLRLRCRLSISVRRSTVRRSTHDTDNLSKFVSTKSANWVNGERW